MSETGQAQGEAKGNSEDCGKLGARAFVKGVATTQFLQIALSGSLRTAV